MAKPIVWIGAAMVASGFTIVLVEVLTVVVRAPRGRTLIASRLGVALACAHVVAAFCLGAVIFSRDAPFAGLSYGRWLLIHLHVALLGWIALLILTVTATSARCSRRRPRRPNARGRSKNLHSSPASGCCSSAWGREERVATLAGGVVVIVAVGWFCSPHRADGARFRHGPLEAPLAHLLAGGFFLTQAAGLRLAAAAGADSTRLVSGYVVLLLVGWAGGVVVGLSGSCCRSRYGSGGPPARGPSSPSSTRAPSGSPRRSRSRSESSLLRWAAFVGSAALARTGAVILCASAVLTAGGAATTWRRRAPADRWERVRTTQVAARTSQACVGRSRKS